MKNPFDLLRFNKSLKKVDKTTLEKFSNTLLPKFLIDEWKNRGFASYMDGFIQTTNPEDYYEIIEDWVDEPKNCHVILRTAFGSFIYLKDDNYYQIEVIYNINSNLRKRLDFILEFSLCNKNYLKNSLHFDIFKKAYKKLNSIDYDEVYAFVPLISLGGSFNPENIKIAKIKEHLSMLAQS